MRIVGVVAVADLVEGDGRGAEALGGARTFLPWFPVPQGLRPTGLVWLWPLTDTPARTADDSVTGARAIAAFSANGRLTRLLGLAATSPVPLEVVVDPALVETARALADGATGPAGTTSAPDPGAAAWLQDVAALTARAPYDVYPYADPDIAALHRAGSDLDLARAITSAPRRTAALLSTPPRTVLPWPQLGRLDAGALEGLGAAGATRVVLSDRTLPTDRSQTADGVGRVGGSAGLTALISDTGLDTALRITGAGRVIQRQRFLAELAQTTLDDPSAGHLLVVAPPAAWNPDPTTIRALLGVLSTSTWARAATVAELLATPGATDSPTRTLAEYTTRARSAELPQAYLRGIQAGRAELDTFRSVVADPADSRTLALEDALSRCQSSSWRSDLPGGRALLATTNAAITALNSAIRVVGSSSTTFPGETGIVPVTVANDLETPVRVGVRLSGSPAPRFESAPVAPVTIEPGAKMSLEVPARVIGSGDVLVSVQLTAPDGRDFAAPARVVVRSTAYARAASWIVGALAVLLVGLIAVNVVRRRSVGRAARESSART